MKRTHNTEREHASVQELFLPILLCLLMLAASGYRLMQRDWRSTYLSYKVLHSIDYGQTSTDGVLHLKPGTNDMNWVSDLSIGCQILWKSRIIAGNDLNEARKVMENDTGCNQNELYYEWRAQLEWLLGNQQDAVHYWQYLGMPQLWSLAKSNFINGDIDQAQAVFDILLSRPSLNLRAIDKIVFFTDLGGLYRQKGDWEKAAQYYKIAWELDGKSYDFSYLLGHAYWNLKQCQEAIPVFEAGLNNQSKQHHTQTDFFYHAFLGNCYATLGYNDEAKINYSVAQRILEENKDRSPQEFIESQGRWLKSLQYAINTEMEP
jgi:tetratricopeptide (TPR) repeat protein